MQITLLFLLCYALGTLSFGICVEYLFKLPHLRAQGSGNIGASNVWRIGGPLPAVLTLLGDAAKGYIAVLLALWIEPTALAMHLAGLAVLLGHIYPATLRFKGGKGVATAFGVFLAWSWIFACFLFGIWCLILGIKRIVSAASLTVAALAPFILLGMGDPHAASWTVIFTILIFSAHRDNIARLAKKREYRL